MSNPSFKHWYPTRSALIEHLLNRGAQYKGEEGWTVRDKVVHMEEHPLHGWTYHLV